MIDISSLIDRSAGALLAFEVLRARDEGADLGVIEDSINNLLPGDACSEVDAEGAVHILEFRGGPRIGALGVSGAALVLTCNGTPITLWCATSYDYAAFAVLGKDVGDATEVQIIPALNVALQKGARMLRPAISARCAAYYLGRGLVGRAWVEYDARGASYIARAWRRA